MDYINIPPTESMNYFIKFFNFTTKLIATHRCYCFRSLSLLKTKNFVNNHQLIYQFAKCEF